MITGIIFACVIGKDICVLEAQEFDTVQECILVSTEVTKVLEAELPEAKLYYICEPESLPL